MQNNLADGKFCGVSGLSLLVFSSLFFSCALTSLAVLQTSFSGFTDGSEDFDASYLNWRSSEGAFPGIITVNRSGTLLGADAIAAPFWVSHAMDNPPLAIDDVNSLAPEVHSRTVELERTAALSGNVLPRRLIESAAQTHFPAQSTSTDTDFTSFLAMATFPERALDLEITPVAEPGTWIAAALGAAFLIWKRRKFLVAFSPRLQFIRISVFPAV